VKNILIETFPGIGNMYLVALHFNYRVFCFCEAFLFHKGMRFLKLWFCFMLIKKGNLSLQGLGRRYRVNSKLFACFEPIDCHFVFKWHCYEFPPGENNHICKPLDSQTV